MVAQQIYSFSFLLFFLLQLLLLFLLSCSYLIIHIPIIILVTDYYLWQIQIMKGKPNYRVLTIPTKKVLTYEHIYYKEYDKEDKDLIEVPEKRTIYTIRFDQPFTSEYVKKYFGLAGKIQTAHMGEYKHRSNNKKKRRQLWFAIIVYKRSADWEKAMDSKWLQGQINKAFGDGKGKWRISFNPEMEDEGKAQPQLTEEEKTQHDKIKEMEEEGFTVMLPSGSKRYISDGNTSMKVITKGMIENMMGKNKKKGEPEGGFDFYESTKTRKKKLQEGEKGFYMYETKEQKKKELEELRKGLEEDMRKIRKMKKTKVDSADEQYLNHISLLSLVIKRRKNPRWCNLVSTAVLLTADPSSTLGLGPFFSLEFVFAVIKYIYSIMHT
eukprot:TRINITY_DN609_c0_g1_i1.p8 TRINITY_DN609_c0_g1~~TRINITY_DN609_c0_g1_i1.p8  ORF type:complete len:381 (-),score=54.01 TRINITY_DN609_c0_g1_i1:11519-12661(-)